MQAQEISAEAVEEYTSRVETFHELCTIEDSDEEFLGDVIILEDGSNFSCVEEHRYLKELYPEMMKLVNDETILNAQDHCETQETTVSEQLDEMGSQATLFSSKTSCENQEKASRSERCGEEFKCNSLRALRSAGSWNWMPSVVMNSVNSFTENHVRENNLPESCLDNSRGDCLANIVSSIAANFESTKAAFGALLEKETWSKIFSNVSMPTMAGLKNRFLKTKENVTKLMSVGGQLEMLSDMQNKIMQTVDPWLRNQVLCQKWAAEPHQSDCLEPLESLDCLGCSEYVNAVCSAIGVIGSEGIMLVLTGGAATLTSAAVKGVVRISVARAGQLATRIGAMTPELNAASKMSNRSRAGAAGLSSLGQRSVAVAKLAGKLGSEAFTKVKALLEKGRVMVSPVTERIAAATRIIGAPADFAADLGASAGRMLARRAPILNKGVSPRAVAGAAHEVSRGGTVIVTANRAASAYSSGRAARAANNSVNLFDKPNRPPQAPTSPTNPHSPSNTAPPQGSGSQNQLNANSGSGQSNNQAPQLSESSRSNQNSGSGSSSNEQQKKEEASESNTRGALGRSALALDVIAKSTGLGQEEVSAELETIIANQTSSEVPLNGLPTSQNPSATTSSTSGSSSSAERSDAGIQNPDQAREILNQKGRGEMSASEYEQTRQKMEAFYAEENRQKVLEQIKAIRGVSDEEAQDLFEKRKSQVFKALDYMADASAKRRNPRDWSDLERNADLLRSEIEYLEGELAKPLSSSEEEEYVSQRIRPNRRNERDYPDYEPTPAPTPQARAAASSGSGSRAPARSSGVSSSSGGAGSPFASGTSGAGSASALPTSANDATNSRAPASLSEEELVDDEDRADSDDMESLLDEVLEGDQEFPWELSAIQANSEEAKKLLAQLKQIKQENGSIQGQYTIRERDGVIIHEFSIGEKTYLFDILSNGQARLLAQ